MATVLIAGVNLFALALVLNLMLGWSISVAILAAAAVVLVYITLGGLTSAMYNEVLQFFMIVVGLVGSSEVKSKADGVNVNLWAGLVMLAFGIGMVAWALLRPVHVES